MNIITNATELRRVLAPSRNHERIAFVATMGCLHEGHLSLIRKAKKLADIVVVSIYVNPMQFGPNEDFDAYPRTFEQDSKLCESEGVDIIFHPEKLYPEEGARISLKVDDLDSCLCGATRPGHFNGVVTVVNMLFNIVQPDIAIFGEKDWQQLAIIHRMVHDLHMNVEIISSETVRESDGLAMSSRNRYLSEDNRSKASLLHQTLQSIQSLHEQGENNVGLLIQSGLKQLSLAGIEPEYLEIRDAKMLKTIDQIEEQACRIFVAAKIGTARLIDNIALKMENEEMPLSATESLV